jgi:CrcB protein
MQSTLMVAMGGALGSSARYLCSKVVIGLLGASFPYGTMFINIAGSFLMGVCVTVFAGTEIPDSTKLFFMTGLLGGFTTFSAFSLDAYTLYEKGEMAMAGLYILLSCAVSIFGLFAGLALGKSFVS